jgi:hypothetical protein
MSRPAHRLWKYLFERSPRATSTPNVQPQAPDPVASGQPIERNLDMQSAVGLLLRVGRIENLLRGDEGELIRAHEHKSCLLGCGHIITQLQPEERDGCHIRGLGGPCAYCLRENTGRLDKGELSPFDAERLSLVCSDCAKMTSSGVLCCPRHYTAVTAADGSEQYVDRDGAVQLKRQRTIAKAFGLVRSLFGEEEEPPSQSPSDKESLK